LNHPDDPIFELVKADAMDAFQLALRIHSALAEAYNERTGLVLEKDSEYTTSDCRRANRILACEGIPGGSRRRTRRALEILDLKPKKG
jgi:hypothetical protein